MFARTTHFKVSQHATRRPFDRSRPLRVQVAATPPHTNFKTQCAAAPSTISFVHQNGICNASPPASRPQSRVVRAAAAASVAASAVPATLLGHSTWAIWAALAAAGAAGLHLERTRWGKELSGALLSTLIGLALSNLNVIPAEAPQIHSVVNSYLLPLAVPLLLLAADLRRVFGSTGRLLVAFVWGAVATVVGSFTAFAAMPLRELGADGWKVAAALTARHIGGSVNYVAVSEALSLSPAARMAGLAADDVIVSLYFVALYALARRSPSDPPQSSPAEEDPKGKAAEETRAPITVLNGATALALSAAICAIGQHITTTIGYKGGLITVVTALTVALATATPRLVAPLTASGECLAGIIMQLFFASVGASGKISVVLESAPSLFAWSAVAITVHVGLVLLWERLFGFTRRDTCLASNANIGGPTTAAGMAVAKGWRTSTVPALLVGIFGYATATFVGVAAAQAFKHMQRAAMAAAL